MNTAYNPEVAADKGRERYKSNGQFEGRRSKAMPRFDYTAEAELYPLIRRKFTRGPVGYKRFTSAAEAIRFAVEELPPDLLRGAYLEVDEERFDAKGIRQLYESDTYPLGRRA